MPIDHEDKTDVSGAPDPVRARTPSQVHGDTRQKVNQNRRGPQPGQQEQGGQSPLGKLGSEVGGGLEGAGKWLQGQGFAQPKQGDLNPIDWATEYERDASVPWGYARDAYKTLSGAMGNAYHDGVANLFAGHDAKSRILQSGASAAVEGLLPILGAKEQAQEEVSQLGVLTGRQTEEQAQQEQQREREQAVQDAPGAAAEQATLALPTTGAEGLAAQVALPFAQQMLESKDQGDVTSAVAWAAVGSLLSFGHIPAPVRKLLQERFGPGWSDVEKMVGDAVKSRRDAGRNAMDPEKAAQATKDWIAKQVQHGGLPEFRKELEPAAPSDKALTKDLLTPWGTDEELLKRRQRILSKLGVTSATELPRAAQEGKLGSKETKLIQKHWQTLGMPYNLEYRAPGEAALRDPRVALDEIQNPELSAKATSHVASLHHYLAEVHSGLFAGAKDPATAVLRALAGHSRVLDLVHQDYMQSMVDALDHAWGASHENGRALMKAAEGDEEAYTALPPEARAVVDGWGLLRAAMREQSQGTNYAKNFVANWVPRLDVFAEKQAGRGRPSTTSVLAREARKKRATAVNLDPATGQLTLGQRYATVQDTNRALESARQALADSLADPARELPKDLANDAEAKDIKRLAQSDPEQAAQRARQLAQDRLAPKEESFLAAVGRAAGYQAKAIATAKALREFEQTVIRTRHPNGGNVLRHAAVTWKTQRDREEFLKQGYKPIEDPRFSNHLFDGNFKTDLDRYISHVGKGLRDATFWGGLLQLEKKLVSWIMFWPMIHGMNMAGRMGMAAMMNPLSMLHYLKQGKAVLPHMADEASYQLRREAWQSGVLPMRRGKGWADNVMNTMQDALGDIEDILPESSANPKAGRLGTLTGNVARAYHGVNDYFWSGVHDFGVTMYHLEKEAAVRHGVDETSARLYAARRANSWMGMVAPEDTNPMMHDLSRLMFFAPNWWRTWAELAIPVYRRSGIINDATMLRHTAYQGAKTAMAAMAFQKLTGNLLNYAATSSTPWALDGHLQKDNQPGSQDRIEATGAWLNGLPGFSGIAPVNAKTGARRTIENPLARQTYDIEQAAGFQSGQPDYQWTDTADGLAKFFASRLSPALDSIGAMANIDLYGTLTQHQLRAVIQDQTPGQVSPLSLVAGALYGLPGATQFARNAQRNQDPNQQDPSVSILGTRVPKGLSDYVKDAGDAGARTVLSGLLGINAPYASAQKTRGQPISDQDYQKVQQEQQQYRQQMQTLSAEALSGQKTPSQWRAAYQDLSKKHANQMEALYRGAPNYVNGSDGLVNDWQGLYDQATLPDGTVDQSHLAELQAQFRSQKTPEQMQQLQAGLRKSDTQYPMLALYHKTLDAYDQWQEQWAAQQGVDVTRLRQESSEYGKLHGDTTAERMYLRDHPELRAFQRAKASQFERTPQGLMYSLFYGQSPTILRALRARHLTEAQLAEQQAGAA